MYNWQTTFCMIWAYLSTKFIGVMGGTLSVHNVDFEFLRRLIDDFRQSEAKFKHS